MLIPGNLMKSRWVSQLCGYGFQENITAGIAWSWLLRTGVATSSNIFVPFEHSMGEWPSQVPG